MTDLKLKLKNISQGRKYITNILGNYKIGIQIQDNDILELLTYHPYKQLNRDILSSLTMEKGMFNQPVLSYKLNDTDTFDEISYVKCIQNLFGKYKSDDVDRPKKRQCLIKIETLG